MVKNDLKTSRNKNSDKFQVQLLQGKLGILNTGVKQDTFRLTVPGLESRAKALTTCTDLLGAEPDVPHVVADGLGGGHGAGQLPGLDDGCTALLHGLRGRKRRGFKRRLFFRLAGVEVRGGERSQR